MSSTSTALFLGPCLRTTVLEIAHAGFFSVVVAGVCGAVGFGLWSLDISLVQADVEGAASTVLLASLLPAFFGAWVFFLARRIAWSGPGAAFAVASAAAALAVVAHRNVLLSTFFEGYDSSPCSAWVAAALGQSPRAGAVDTTLVAELAVVVGAGVCAFVAQRLLSRPRVRRAS